MGKKLNLTVSKPLTDEEIAAKMEEIKQSGGVIAPHWTRIRANAKKCDGCGKLLYPEKVWSTDNGLFCCKECDNATV